MADGSKICRCCEATFASADSRRVYCSPACRKKAARDGTGRPTCSIPGCGRNAKAYGWCQRHYERWRASGDPGEASARRAPAGAPCEVTGCDSQSIARGMCRKHYARWASEQIPSDVKRLKWRQSYHRHKKEIGERNRAKKPPTQQRPCLDCGAMIYRKHPRSDLARRCEACQAERVKVKGRVRGTARRSCVTETTCWTCGVLFALPKTRKRGKIAGYCPECRKLKNRQRRAERRAKERYGDVTDAVLLALSRKRFCALCGVAMTRKAGPRQRQIDHIVPLNVGGAHTPANLRAVCRSCNYSRPKDGSDLVQMLLI